MSYGRKHSVWCQGPALEGPNPGHRMLSGLLVALGGQHLFFWAPGFSRARAGRAGGLRGVGRLMPLGAAFSHQLLAVGRWKAWLPSHPGWEPSESQPTEPFREPHGAGPGAGGDKRLPPTPSFCFLPFVVPLPLSLTAAAWVAFQHGFWARVFFWENSTETLLGK